MEDIYLIPLRLKPFNLTIESIYLKDIYCIYPKEYAKKEYSIDSYYKKLICIYNKVKENK